MAPSACVASMQLAIIIVSSWPATLVRQQLAYTLHWIFFNKCAVPLLQGLQFSDKDEHMYFWFPLLAGLSELTFDPRPDIRYSALEVLFDTLKFHGSAFTLPFWTRIFDSVLLPIFDHVRAEVNLRSPPPVQL